MWKRFLSIVIFLWWKIKLSIGILNIICYWYYIVFVNIEENKVFILVLFSIVLKDLIRVIIKEKE